MHRVSENNLYLLTGTCFEHQSILDSDARRDEFAEKLLSRFRAIANSELFAWCLLPNHYHLLARVDLKGFSQTIARLYNGTSTQWNREDGTPGRKVWFSFCDRTIRSERHFWASMNYVHANAVKHQWAKTAFGWPWCSVHEYAELHGREALREMWRDYPVLSYGQGWDD